MIDEVAKFIKNEKEIAEYKLSLLRASKERPHTKRLISKEEEYISFPFEEMLFKDISEARDALTLFKVDKHDFLAKFSIKEKEERASDRQIEVVSEKLLFLESSYEDLIEKEIRSDKIDAHLSSVSGKTSGAIFLKAKARIQILICCLARYVFTEGRRLKNLIHPEISRDDLLKIKKDIDNFYERSNYEIFKFYNESIDHADKLFSEEDGNEFILSTYPLVNIFDKYHEFDFKLKRMIAGNKKIFSKGGTPIAKRSIERAFGIATPLNRVGNETTDVLYRDVFSSSGACISPILERSFHNAKLEGGEYVRGLSSIPIWDMLNKQYGESLLSEISYLLDISPGEEGYLTKSSLKNINAINSSNNAIDIDCDKSKILIAATRSEADKINDAKKYIDLLIKELKEDYVARFNLPDNNDSKSRKDKIKEIAGSLKHG